MARGYDDSIRIDTSIDEKGLNSGIRNISNKINTLGKKIAVGFNSGIKNIGTKIKTIGTKISQGALAMAAGFMRVIGIISGIVLGVTLVIRAISRMVNNVITMGTQTQAVKQDFENLKLSVRNAFLPLLSVALPLLQRVAQWLTKIFNIVGMVFAALTGQTHVMRATADAAADAAGSTGEMAKNVKEAEKAAKGSLAAFDEINVLQIEEPTEEPEPGGGGGGGGGGGAGGVGGDGGFTLEPISQKILDFIQKIKDFFQPLWEPLRNLWDALEGLGEAIWEAISPLFGDLADSGILEFLRDLAINGIEWLTEKITQLTEWINNNQEAFQKIIIVIGLVALALLLIISPTIAVIAAIAAVIFIIAVFIKYWPQLKEKAIEAWNKIKEVWGKVAEWFVTKVWQPIKTWAMNVLNSIGDFFKDAWEFIVSQWNGAVAWFSNLWNGILDAIEFVLHLIKIKASLAWLNIKLAWFKAKTFFNELFGGISEKWTEFTDNIKEGLKGALNIALGWVEGFVNFFIRAINKMIDVLNTLSIEIPNIPFLGLNGGTIGFNIAPLNEISIPRLATGAVIPPNSQFLAVMGDQRTGQNLEAPEELIRQIVREEGGNQEITINFGGSLGALVRQLKPYIDKENARIGRSMVRGV